MLKESYESYVELKKLAQEICYHKNEFESPRKKDQDSDDLFKYYIKNIVNINNYNELKNFINSDIRICLYYEYSGGGGYNPSENIVLIYGAKNFIFSTVIHELQHAYNDFISKGKTSVYGATKQERQESIYMNKFNKRPAYIDKFTNFLLKYEKDIPYTDYDEMCQQIKSLINKSGLNVTEEQINDFCNYYWEQSNYLIKAHDRDTDELSAFFTAAIAQINFFENNRIKDFRDVYNEFKETLVGADSRSKRKTWNYLTPKMQRNLLNKLSQYWHKIKEDYEMKKQFVREDMGGVGAPMATPMNTPGMGTATLPSAATGGIGSGDNWGNSKKPHTQSNKPLLKKAKKKRVVLKKKKVATIKEAMNFERGLEPKKAMGYDPEEEFIEDLSEKTGGGLHMYLEPGQRTELFNLSKTHDITTVMWFLDYDPDSVQGISEEWYEKWINPKEKEGWIVWNFFRMDEQAEYILIRPKKVTESNINPYDKIAMSMACDMRIVPPFKKKAEEGNQNAVESEQYDDELPPFDELMNEEFKSKAQQGLFFAKAKHSKKWAKMAKEFAHSTNWKKKLPKKVKKSKKTMKEGFNHEIISLEQFLNEKLERGQEPKDAMGTGASDERLKEFKDYFNMKYSYISHSLSDKEILDFINQTWVKNRTIPQMVDLFQDYLLSQGMEDDVML